MRAQLRFGDRLTALRSSTPASCRGTGRWDPTVQGTGTGARGPNRSSADRCPPTRDADAEGDPSLDDTKFVDSEN